MSLIASPTRSVLILLLFGAALPALAQKPRIAIFSGPTATIQNSQPLVTSNYARAKRNDREPDHEGAHADSLT